VVLAAARFHSTYVAYSVNPFAAEELGEDAERCEAEAKRLRELSRTLAAQSRLALLDSESYDLLAHSSRVLAECDAMLQDKGL